jgi:hypothetical protein
MLVMQQQVCRGEGGVLAARVIARDQYSDVSCVRSGGRKDSTLRVFSLEGLAPPWAECGKGSGEPSAWKAVLANAGR